MKVTIRLINARVLIDGRELTRGASIEMSETKTEFVKFALRLIWAALWRRG